jgi:hypothetical protein
MRVSVRLLAVWFAVALLVPGSFSLADDDDEKGATKPEKTPDKLVPTEVTTPGAIAVGGQHVAYNAVVGTITVGPRTRRMRSLAMMASR